MGKKLVIFDIDGTLIRPLRPMENLQRFRFSINKIFGKDIGEITEDRWKKNNYNGMGDRAILWSMIEPHGIARDAFLDRIGEIGDGFAEYLDLHAREVPSYEVIPDAQKLVDMVIESKHLSEGVLTGNLGQSARWKLHSVGLPEFAFGVYGHEADTRNDLAKLLLPKAQSYFGKIIDPSDLIIIGDTAYDAQCAKVIGAYAVIVGTGWNLHRKDLEAAAPDLLVDSLMDERVLELLELKQ